MKFTTTLIILLASNQVEALKTTLKQKQAIQDDGAVPPVTEDLEDAGKEEEIMSSLKEVGKDIEGSTPDELI